MLKQGDRVSVAGGYDMEPRWLEGHPDGYIGTVEGFLQDTNGHDAAVIQLEQEVTMAGASSGKSLRGRYLLLTFAWAEMNWSEPGPRLHVHLLEDVPAKYLSEAEFHQRWVESHASWDFA